MSETKNSKVDDQIMQIGNSLDQMGAAIETLNTSVSTACVPEGPCETPGSDCGNAHTPHSPLVGALRDLNRRLCDLLQRVADINERIEL